MGAFILTKPQFSALAALTHGEGPWLVQPVVPGQLEPSHLLVRCQKTDRVWSISPRGATERLTP